jgi:hypothetical protein
MGSLWKQNMTLDESIREDLGSDWRIVASGAGDGTGEQRTKWLAIEHRESKERMAVCVLWSRWDHGVCTKWVSEDMGPGDHLVPDNVWDAIKDTAHQGSYSKDWRIAVEAYRAEYPLGLSELNDEHLGCKLKIGDWQGSEAYYQGKRRGAQILEFFEGIRRYPKTLERLLRCRIIPT